VKEQGVKRNQIIRELIRSAHGDLESYIPTTTEAAKQEPEFLAHLIAWNYKNGQIRDSKIALPIASLEAWANAPAHERSNGLGEYQENSLAHLAMLDPRNLVKAIRFGKSHHVAGKKIRRLVERYLREREANWSWWERTAIQHRASMKTLYAMFHIKPTAMADLSLMKGKPPSGTALDVIKRLPTMNASEAAVAVSERNIPFLVVMGTIGNRLKSEDALAIALIERMSPTELVTNTKLLERIGVRDRPALRAAFELGLEKAATSKKTTFKATRAAEEVASPSLKAKLQNLQEKQIETLGGVDGNWLVLGDRSGSMEPAITVSREISGTLARMVKGEIHLVFFHDSPQYFDVSGKTYDEINKLTTRIHAGGTTSIGCGLSYIREKGIEVDGIAIVSDGHENCHPSFAAEYQKYVELFGKEPPVYFYKVSSPYYHADATSLEATAKIVHLDLQVFSLPSGVDRESLPQLVKTMRTSKYSLADEILASKLLRLDDVFKTPAA